MSELRSAFRLFFRDPAFTVAATIVLALGMGVTTAIFTLLHSVLLEPLPYPSSDRLVWITGAPPRSGQGLTGMLGGDFLEFRERSHSYDKIAALGQGLWVMSGAGEAESINGARVSPGYFETLGFRPLLGRVFSDSEHRVGHEMEVIFSYKFWRRKFGGDPGVIGRRVTLDGTPYEVVGVAPADFPPGEDSDMWAPLQMDGAYATGRNFRGLRVFGRLKNGITVEQAQGEAAAIAADLAGRYPNDAGYGLKLTTFLDRAVGGVRQTLWIFAAAVGCVLLIACSNVASLLLARGAVRTREMAVRAAVGASRAVLIRQMLVESGILALAGGALGLILASAGLRLLLAAAPNALPRIGEIHIDAGVLAFAFAASLVTGVIFGIAPALRGSRVNLSEAIKEGGRSGMPGIRANRFRAALVVVEVALGVVLMTSAGLLARTFRALTLVEPGYNVENVLTLKVALLGSRYRTADTWRAFFDRLLPEIERIPGVEAAGTTNWLPLQTDRNTAALWLDTQPLHSEQTKIRMDNRVVTPGYFRAMGIRVLAGRNFEATDRTDTPPVMLVNDAFAREFYPAGAIGHRVTLNAGAGYTAEIIGVVGSYRELSLSEDPRPELFTPLSQTTIAGQTLVVRTTGDPARYAAAVRAAVASIDPDIPVYGTRAMRDLVAESLAQQRLRGALLGVFSLIALVLASIGLYGVIACAVAERRQEIGIRMALGAQRGQVLRLVVGSGLKLTGIGLILGMLAAAAATRLIAAFLYGVAPADPVSFGLTVAIFLGVAVAASYGPARRATRIDPIEVLRQD